jgi:hypothetical protein
MDIRELIVKIAKEAIEINGPMNAKELAIIIRQTRLINSYSSTSANEVAQILKRYSNKEIRRKKVMRTVYYFVKGQKVKTFLPKQHPIKEDIDYMLHWYENEGF